MGWSTITTGLAGIKGGGLEILGGGGEFSSSTVLENSKGSYWLVG